MKTITFYESNRRDANELKIETDGCTVSIRVGLVNADGQKVTRVDVSPDDASRGGDGLGNVWELTEGDAAGVSRVVCVKTGE